MIGKQGRHPPHDVLQVEQGVPRRWQKTAQRGHYPGGLVPIALGMVEEERADTSKGLG